MTSVTMRHPETGAETAIYWPADVLTSDCDVVAHQTNCKGVMGRGIAKTIRTVFPEIFKPYRALCENARKNGQSADLLGTCQLIKTDDSTLSVKIIANLFGQDSYGTTRQQTDYEAAKKAAQSLRDQLDKLPAPAGKPGFKVGVPIMIGCALGGGDWETYLPVFVNAFFNKPDCRHTLAFYGIADKPDTANQTFRILRDVLKFQAKNIQKAA